MAELVLRQIQQSRTQDPTAALKQALSAFENILTDEQKHGFLGSNSKPDISSVISFVAEVDSNASSQTRRCVAPRLYTFLESTQQFTAIVDTFVSSNPQIAALIWGGLKFAILSAKNISSYFEKVTSMIMEIGKSCPKYQQFGQLYPGCIGLQRELCEYYAVIVHLCIKIIEVSRRAPLSQLVSSVFTPFESEFQPLLDLLEKSEKAVRSEISLAANQAVEEMRKLLQHESTANTSFQLRSLRFQGRSQKEHDEAKEWRLNKLKRDDSKLRSTIKDLLSTVNFTKPWRQAIRQRVPVTAEWLQQEAKFSQWRNDAKTSLLWCPGNMGVGKTIMMSNLVSHLHSSRKHDDVVSYYLCSVGDPSFLSARSVFGTIARQLLESHIEAQSGSSLRELERVCNDLDALDIVDLLLAHLNGDKKYFIVLDGLDELDSEEIETMLSLGLKKLCTSPDHVFKIVCAGRFELERRLFRSNKAAFVLPITGPKVNLDIDQYISTKLNHCLEEERLKLGDPSLIIDISKALLEGSNGMFLWTHLTIQDLCLQSTDNDIKSALENLPRSLQEIFDQRISRIRSCQGSDNAIKALQYCGALKRPLTVLEYQEALSLSPGQKSLDRGSFPNDMNRIWNDCCGLVFVDEEDDTVHYVHQSVKQYLFTTVNSIGGLLDFETTLINRHLGVLCMTYLDFSDFKRQLAKVQKKLNIPLQPLQLGLSSISRPQSAINRIALSLLSSRRQQEDPKVREVQKSVGELLINDYAPSTQKADLQDTFHFFEYASTHWFGHTAQIDPWKTADAWALFCKCMENNDVFAPKPWDIEATEKDDKHCSISPKELIAEDHFALLTYFEMSLWKKLPETTISGVLRCCSKKDRPGLTMPIVSSGESPEAVDYCLFYAAQAGCITSVDLALHSSRGAGVNNIVHNRTALHQAAREGHVDIVNLLLALGAEVDKDTPYGRTPLQEASKFGHLEVVESLLQAGADSNALPHPRRSPIQEAAAGGHVEVVDRLLRAGAGLSGEAGIGLLPYTKEHKLALELATENGHLDVVKRLLATHMSILATGYNQTLVKTDVYDDALLAAARGNHLEIQEQILIRAYDAVTEKWEQLLERAASGGNFEMVNRILSRGPLSSESYTAAAEGATAGGFLDVADMILEIMRMRTVKPRVDV